MVTISPKRGFSVAKVAKGWLLKVARRDFLGGYLSSLSINYVAMKKRLPQLYYIKTKISYDVGFIAIRFAMAT